MDGVYDQSTCARIRARFKTGPAQSLLITFQPIDTGIVDEISCFFKKRRNPKLFSELQPWSY